jgi:hypothetical protein
MYIWLDPQSYGFGFGYSSLWSLAGLVHAPGGGHLPLAAGSAAPGIVHVIFTLNIRIGVCPHYQVPTMVAATHYKQTHILCRAWIIRRARVTAISLLTPALFQWLRLMLLFSCLIGGMPVGECPGRWQR